MASSASSTRGALAVCLSLFGCAPAAPAASPTGAMAPADRAREIKAVDATIDQWEQAWNAPDFKAAVTDATATMAPDMILVDPDNSVSMGKKAIVDALRMYLAGISMVTRTRYTDRTIALSQDGHVAWAFYRMDGELVAAGKPMSLKGVISNVLEKRDGRWLYVVEHISNDPAPAPR